MRILTLRSLASLLLIFFGLVMSSAHLGHAPAPEGMRVLFSEIGSYEEKGIQPPPEMWTRLHEFESQLKEKDRQNEATQLLLGLAVASCGLVLLLLGFKKPRNV